MDMQQLVGKTVNEIAVSEDKDFISFKCNETKEVFVFIASGDCCSNTWIDEVSFYKGFLPAKIAEIKEEDGGEISHPTYDSLKTYHVRLKREKDEERWGGGEAIITFKNSSNGYYGGSLEKWEGDYKAEKMKVVEGQ